MSGPGQRFINQVGFDRDRSDGKDDLEKATQDMFLAMSKTLRFGQESREKNRECIQGWDDTEPAGLNHEPLFYTVEVCLLLGGLLHGYSEVMAKLDHSNKARFTKAWYA